MTDNEKYLNQVFEQLEGRLKGVNAADVIAEIAQKYAGKPLVLDKEDQCVLGAILGSMLHQSYCDSRKLAEPLPDGRVNNPRLKKLTEPIDQEFVEKVKSGEIPQSSTLYIDENGVVIMDIANTKFMDLSPYWKKDNFMAGCAATRTVLTCFEGLTHNDPTVRKFVVVAVANAIHEAWIARGNVSDWNKELDTAYINLPTDEKEKDLEHYKMAMSLVGELVREMENAKNSGDGQPGDH